MTTNATIPIRDVIRTLAWLQGKQIDPERRALIGEAGRIVARVAQTDDGIRERNEKIAELRKQRDELAGNVANLKGEVARLLRESERVAREAEAHRERTIEEMQKAEAGVRAELTAIRGMFQTAMDRMVAVCDEEPKGG